MNSRFKFDTHYGRSSVVDTETGVVVEWENGRFNETQKTSHDAATIETIIPEGRTLEGYVAEVMLEIGQFVLENYPELV